MFAVEMCSRQPVTDGQGSPVSTHTPSQPLVCQGSGWRRRSERSVSAPRQPAQPTSPQTTINLHEMTPQTTPARTKGGPERCRMRQPGPEILYMEGKQRLRRLLLQPRAVEREVADLLALSIEQEGPGGWRGHIGTGRGPDAGRCDAGETWHINGVGGTRRVMARGALAPQLCTQGGCSAGSPCRAWGGGGHPWGARLLHGGGLPGSERVPWISLPLSSTHQQYPLSPWHCSGVKAPPASHCGTYWSPRGLPP